MTDDETLQAADHVLAGLSSLSEPPIEKHRFTLEVEVDGFWVDYLTKYSDVFGPQYTGYWAYGAEHDEERGWLVYERADVGRPSKEEALRVAELWRADKELPEGWYRLDRAAALRAWEEGVKRWGVNWYEQTDAEREDVVIQLALLGEVRYG